MIDEKLVSKVVSEVLARLQTQNGAARPAAPAAATQYGVYEKMEDAIAAARRSFEKLSDLGMLGRRKLANIEATGATIVASGNVGCTLQIARHARERGVAIEVVHPVDLLDRAYEGDS